MQPITRCPHSGAPTTLPALAARYGLPLALVKERHAKGLTGTKLVSGTNKALTAARANNIRRAAQSAIALPMHRIADARGLHHA